MIPLNEAGGVNVQHCGRTGQVHRGCVARGWHPACPFESERGSAVRRAHCLHSGDEAVKKPIASEANRSLLVRQESMHGAMEKQIHYCNTEEHKANLEVTCERAHHWVSALFGTLWGMKKD